MSRYLESVIKKVIFAVVVLVLLEIVSLLIGVFSSLGYFESFRIVFGSVFVLFLPGFVWSFVFFQCSEERRIDVIERIALSFALSIAVVPLVVFYLNLIGMKITALNSFFVVFGIVVIGLVVSLIRNKSRR